MTPLLEYWTNICVLLGYYFTKKYYCTWLVIIFDLNDVNGSIHRVFYFIGILARGQTIVVAQHFGYVHGVS